MPRLDEHGWSSGLRQRLSATYRTATKKEMEVMQSSEKQNGATFRTHRTVRHPPERVFDAFAQPEVLARWWGPGGFTSTFEVFEFRPGGRWKFVMHGPDGSNHPNESVFLELDGPSRLVVQHRSQPRLILTVILT